MFELKNQLEDFNLFAKNSMQYWHWGLMEFFETDYYDLMEVMNAKKPEDRIQDPMDLIKQLTGRK
ncbi:putative Phage protein [Oenococcus oeni]|nr:hypothetical protein AX764_04350 [Oenococcus oeni]SYV99691.1 putative Phage protein [Oenococcus oeni]SYW03869.1 putative Phage protein [Oenococcus oeni]SYW17647.1 putative Phage protein [Oenococcus oeni]VDC14628.1 putative Phage protein [Oenococcus oeni]